jgi:fructose-bisphosphate aldolase class II
MQDFKPIPGNYIFDSLKEQKTIVIANNLRFIPGIAKGIFRAAKDMDAAVIFEIARSESDLNGGYTGMTPAYYAEHIMQAAKEAGHDIWALHADHITVKKSDPETIEKTKALIDGQIAAGFTSFAIDASYLFDVNAKSVEEQLKENVAVTTELAKHIESKMNRKPFGLEVEVGEIGKTDEHGRVLTTPDEAVTFIRALTKNGIHPNVLAIANGSTHGNVYDERGNPIEQVSIDIAQTKKVAFALRNAGFNVRIAQHGITGTPRELIKTQFPKGDIEKGNVATYWQNLCYDVLKICAPEFYKEIFDWVVSTYSADAAKKGITNPVQIFGTYSKNAFGAKDSEGKFIFFGRLHALDPHIIATMEAKAYAEAMLFLDAFDAAGSASIVRKKLPK